MMWKGRGGESWRRPSSVFGVPCCLRGIGGEWVREQGSPTSMDQIPSRNNPIDGVGSLVEEGKEEGG